MQLAHPRDDRLSRFLVGAHAERRVFLREPIQRDAHLFLVGLGLRLDGDVDHRLGEDHLLERDLLLRIAQRVAGRRFLEADRGGDVAGAHFLDVLALVRVHLQDAADALLAALDRVVDGVAGIHDAGIDAEEHELADERVGHDLEREAREGLVVGGLALAFLAVVELALDRRNVGRRRHVVDHRVEHRLDALVLERRAAQHRDDLVRDRAQAQARLDLGGRQRHGPRRTCSSASRSPRRRSRPSSRAIPSRGRRDPRGCRASRTSFPASNRPSRSPSSSRGRRRLRTCPRRRSAPGSERGSP